MSTTASRLAAFASEYAARERDLAFRHCLVLVRLADEVSVLSGHVSPGMHGEILEALELGIPVLAARPV